MLLLVGLGNPGAEYAQNRHNIGFMAINRIVSQYSFSSWRKKFQGEVCSGVLGGAKVVALKPLTYMNESGRCVNICAKFYKIPPKDIIVIHDDIDLSSGKFRLKEGGGDGGHKGIRSIAAYLGCEFRRIRIGIEHPGDKDQVSNYVLADFSKADAVWLDKLLDVISRYIFYLAKGDDTGFMNKVLIDMKSPEKR